MNLIEAVKSGKPFRRKGFTTWNKHEDNLKMCLGSAIATDWETKPEPREGELCAECFESGEMMDISHGDWCKDKNHTPFKWREVTDE